MTARLLVGVDGGGTGCRAVIAGAEGPVLGIGTGGPANISTDVDGAAAAILQAVQAAAQAAGVGDLSAAGAVLGLAGANVPGATEAVAARLPFRRVRVVSDAVTAVAGALGAADGIVVAIGTGSVLARQRGGEVRQFGGRGFLLGDEGGGAVLGRSLLALALQAEDGFAPMTPLLCEVLDRHGGAEGVIAFGLTARPAAFAEWAPRVAAGDDPAAEVILSAAVAQIGGMIDRLQDGARLPVVFLGGLGPVYAARLAGRWELRAPVGSALDGALALARRGG